MKFQIKNKDKNNFIELNSIKNLKVTLRSNLIEKNNINGLGWRAALNNAGNKHISLKITGILEYSLADSLLYEYAFNNDITEYLISFNDNIYISTEATIELYERYYDPKSFDEFILILVSSGKVSFFNKKIIK